MAKFEVEVRRTQFLTIVVEAETRREAIDKAEDPNNSNWANWDGCENATYDATHINEIPNNKQNEKS